jgi:hypothetical protein
MEWELGQDSQKKYHPKGEYVRLPPVISPSFQYLWGHVSSGSFIVLHLAYISAVLAGSIPKIDHHHVEIRPNNHIIGFQISVHYSFCLMHVMDDIDQLIHEVPATLLPETLGSFK